MMKNFLLFTMIAIAACTAMTQKSLAVESANISSDTSKKPFPPPVGYVNDFYQLFTLQQHKSLDSLVKTYERRTTVEIAIVTFDSSYVSGKDFQEYTLSIAKNWKVGKKEKANGILVALCPDCRRIFIHNGDAIAPRLTDADTKKIIDVTMLPNFKQGNFYKGVYAGIIDIIKKLDGRRQ